MDLRHLALTRLPFETPAHTDERFESSSRREAQARLHPLIELKGIGLMTGEVGSGKTTVCRHVTAALHPGLYRVGYVCLTTGNVLDMDQSIAWELGLPTERSRATAYRAIRTEITRLVCEAKPLPVLVIDEAQHLRNDVLEDLRLLTHFAMDSEHRLCLRLVGLTELRRRLAMAVHESLSQRLVVRHHLRRGAAHPHSPTAHRPGARRRRATALAAPEPRTRRDPAPHRRDPPWKTRARATRRAPRRGRLPHHRHRNELRGRAERRRQWRPPSSRCPAVPDSRFPHPLRVPGNQEREPPPRDTAISHSIPSNHPIPPPSIPVSTLTSWTVTTLRSPSSSQAKCATTLASMRSLSVTW